MASDRLVKFAAHVNAGKKPTKAARLAGYSQSYAERYGEFLTGRARDAGLLMSEDAVRTAAQQVERSLTNPDDLAAMLAALKARAMDGDVAALRTWFERMFGGVPQSVNLNQQGDIRVVFAYEDQGGDGDDTRD